MSQPRGPKLLDISTQDEDAIATDPRAWLGQLIDDTEYIFTHWSELEHEFGADYIQPALPAIRNARLNGNSALQALSDGDLKEAMAAAFRAGMWCDRAKTVVPIFRPLRKRKENAHNAADKSKDVRSADADENKQAVLEERAALVAEGIPKHKLATKIEERLAGTPFTITATRIRQIFKAENKKRK
jgi:hypothetical protein